MSQTDVQKHSESRHRRAGFWLATVCLGIAAAVFFRQPVRPLTEKDLTRARAAWQHAGLQNYVMRVRLIGALEGEHEIQVQNGRVVNMSTGGRPVANHVWAYWTVEGMFQFLDEELSQKKKPAAAFGVAEEEEVFLSAEFDGKLGYPKRFLRQVFGRRHTAEWEVREFRTLPGPGLSSVPARATTSG